MTYTAAPIDAEHSQPMWTTGTILGRGFGRAFLLNTVAASAAWPANNDAYLIPFLVSTPVTFTRMFMLGGTTPGTTNFDLGIYNEGFTLLRSLGATAAVNVTSGVNPAPSGGAFTTPVTLTRGRYYMATSAASTALTLTAHATTNGVPRAIGMFKMATAHPLPTTFVPASMGTTAFIPSVGMMTVAGTIL